MYIFHPTHIQLSPLEVATISDTTIARNKDKQITGVSPLNNPTPQSLVYLARGRESLTKEEQLKLQQIPIHGIILQTKAVIPDGDFSVFLAEDPYSAFLRVVPHFYMRRPAPIGAIHPTAVIGKNCTIAKTVEIGAYAVIGENVTIGEHTTIFPHVTIYDGVCIGDRCVIHSGATIREFCILNNDCYIQNGVVIGSDGFGYVPDKELGIRLVPQVGVVAIESAVDIGANSCIDRATFGITEIGRGTKIDNQVQVGHNVKIGEFALVCAQVGLAGSSTIGDKAVLGGQSGVADHVTIADGVRLGAKTGAISSLEVPGDYLGFPAQPASEFGRGTALMKQLVKKSRSLLRLLKRSPE